MSTINITTQSAGVGLKEELKTQARKRGMKYRAIVTKAIEYAVDNQDRFSSSLSQPRDKGGKHISFEVDSETKKKFKKWAEKDRTSQASKASYVLEKALEDDLLDEILG